MGLKWSEGNGRRRYHGEGEVNGREEQNIRLKRCVVWVDVCLAQVKSRSAT